MACSLSTRSVLTRISSDIGAEPNLRAPLLALKDNESEANWLIRVKVTQSASRARVYNSTTMSVSLWNTARRLIRKPSTPRQFPTTGFEVIGSSHLVEEEKWEWYKPEEFYPVRVGEIFKSQYQVVGKLGYGAYGTAWLCRDLLYAT
jgi:hypothetical protein